MQIQPDEGVSLQFSAKKPGPDIQLGGVRMDFRYRDYFKTAPSTGYETLVYDCMIGDAMLFHRADSVEAGWAVVQPSPRFVAGRQKRAARILPGGQPPAPTPPTSCCGAAAARGGRLLIDEAAFDRRRPVDPVGRFRPARRRGARRRLRPAPTGSMSM